MKVLFVCLGNVARSQMAESFYNTLSGTNNAKSAGVSATCGMFHKHPTSDIIRIMEEEGIDVSNNCVKNLTQDLVDGADEIYVLCERTYCPKLLTESSKTHYEYFPDPFGVDIEYARSVRDDIKAFVSQIIKQHSIDDNYI